MRATLKILIVGMIILFQLSSCFLDEPISYRTNTGGTSEDGSGLGSAYTCADTIACTSSSVSSILQNVSKVAVGDQSVCALLNDGTVACWGGTYGCTPTKISGITTAISVDMSNEACAVLSNGTIECWYSASSTASITGISTAIDIDVSADNKCAVLADGTAKCWGQNEHGQLGDGNHPQFQSSPVSVLNVTQAVNIETAEKGMVRNSDNSAMLWIGYEFSDRTDIFLPTTISGWNNVSSISLSHASDFLVQFSDGTIREASQWPMISDLPNLNSNLASYFSVVPNISSSIQIDAGFWMNCSVLSDGSVMCWDANNFGVDYDPYLGNGAPDGLVDTLPVTVSGISNAINVDVGGYNNGSCYYSQACATLSDGTVKCWGSNYFGNLGDGTSTDRSTPVTVKGF